MCCCVLCVVCCVLCVVCCVLWWCVVCCGGVWFGLVCCDVLCAVCCVLCVVVTCWWLCYALCCVNCCGFCGMYCLLMYWCCVVKGSEVRRKQYKQQVNKTAKSTKNNRTAEKLARANTSNHPGTLANSANTSCHPEYLFYLVLQGGDQHPRAGQRLARPLLGRCGGLGVALCCVVKRAIRG